MLSLPEWALASIFLGACLAGGFAAFVRGLDLSLDPPVKIRFFAEMARRLIMASFIAVIMYPLTKTYGPQPPLVWAVAAISGAFATELLDLLWMVVKEKILTMFKAKDQP